MSAKKKIFVVGIMAIFLIGITTAVWIYSHSGTTSYVVSSEDTISFSDNFEIDEVIDTTNTSVTDVKTIFLTNNNGNLSAIFGMETTIDDVNDSCDNSGDIEISASYEGIPIVDQEAIVIIMGTSEVEITTQMARFSCPQTAVIDIEILT